MVEIDSVIRNLKSLKIESNQNEYYDLIERCDKYENKYKIFRLIRTNCDNLSVAFELILNLVSKLKNSYDNKLVVEVLEYFKTLTDLEIEQYEWISKIVFLILELIRDKKRNNEIKLLVLENIRLCSLRISIINHLFNFMLNDASHEIIYAILVFIPEIGDEFIRVALQQTNPVVLKNLSFVISSLSASQKSLFVNYRHFEGFLDSEHYFIRNCYLDIIYNLVPLFKEINNIDEIKNIIGILEERLHDVYFNVRYKSLNLLGNLFENNNVPKDIRNSLVASIGERTLDKTIVVRKKAVTICSYILINHPFVSEDSLSKRNLENITEDSLAGSNYFNDLNEFHDVMKGILSNIMIILNNKVSNDVHVFVDFVKLSLYYDIEDSKKAFEYIFDLIWEDDVNAVISAFKDIFIRIKLRNIKPYFFLKQFIRREGNASFERIVKDLWKRKILENCFFDELYDMVVSNTDLFEASYLMLSISKYLDDSKYYDLLKHVTDLLFSVNNNEELNEALLVYSNIIRLPIKTRVDDDSKIVKLIIKNLSKMVFFDYKTIQDTIKVLYAVSKDPEVSVRKLLVMMSQKNLNPLKLVYSIGCMGIRHLKYIDLLEKVAKENKEKIKVDKSLVPDDIKERRKSINASRMSMQSFIEIENNPEKYVNFSDQLKDKTDDEIADFFFYLKEKDILYNNNSLLYDYAKLIPTYCDSENENLQNIAYLTLFKLMCLSSEYFLQNQKMFYVSFIHKNHKIRSNAVIAMGDFLLCYNSLIEDNSRCLFESLNDHNATVKKNALLTIYSLLKRNILRISGNSTYLSQLIFDENKEIATITKNIIYSLSENDNFITTLLYERLTTEANEYKVFIDFFLPLLKDRMKELIFLKLLRADTSREIGRYVYSKFNFNEKFIEDIQHMEEFTSLKLGEVQ